MIKSNYILSLSNLLSVIDDREVKVFGSFGTQRYTKNSDIDIIIILKETDNPIYFRHILSQLDCVRRVSINQYVGKDKIYCISQIFDIVLITNTNSTFYELHCA